MLTKIKNWVRPSDQSLATKIEGELTEARAEMELARSACGEATAEAVASGQPLAGDASATFETATKRVRELELALGVIRQRITAQDASKQTAAAAAKLEADRAILAKVKEAGGEFDACLVSLERAGDHLASVMAVAEGIGNEAVHHALTGARLRLPTILAARLKKFPSVKQAPPTIDTGEITKWLPGPELVALAAHKKGVHHD